MAFRGIMFAINGVGVTSPDEEVWAHNTMGDDLDGLQKRSAFSRLEWRRTVGERCDLDWFPYDNTMLASLTTRPPGETDTHETYTDVLCKSVTMRHRRSVGSEIVATFLVNLGEVVV